MPMVDVFARETTTQGSVYPRGARVPAELFMPARYQKLVDQRLIVRVEHERGRTYPEPREAPPALPELPPELADAVARVRAAKAELATAELNLVGVERGLAAAIATQTESTAEPAEVDGLQVPGYLS